MQGADNASPQITAQSRFMPSLHTGEPSVAKGLGIADFRLSIAE
jgi:hypothetical protein